MRKLIILAVFILGSCSSIEEAGIGKLKIDCQIITKVQSSVPTTCIDYTSGREIGEAKGELYLIENGKQIKLLSFEIRGVKAFEGQAQAAAAVQQITKDVAGSVERILPLVVEGAIKGIKGPLP